MGVMGILLPLERMRVNEYAKHFTVIKNVQTLRTHLSVFLVTLSIAWAKKLSTNGEGKLNFSCNSVDQ